jgi:hypothetical protein
MKKSRPPLQHTEVKLGGVVDEATWMAVIGNAWRRRGRRCTSRRQR